MIFKILLPAIVGMLIYFLGKSHARRARLPASVAPALQPIMTVRAKWRSSFQLAAYLLLGMALLATVWVVYDGWQSAQKPVEVRVIHVQTGATAVYQALQGQVHGRTFQTLDGRQVRLADVERMEVGE